MPSWRRLNVRLTLRPNERARWPTATTNSQNKELKEKLRFEEDRLEDANRRINEANDRADAVEQQMQDEIEQLEE